MLNGELVNVLLRNPMLRLDQVILAFASGSSMHGARIEGKSDLDVAGVYIGDPVFELALGNEDPRQKGHITQGTSDQYEKNTADDTDLKAYTLRRWAGLAMKGNPTILSYLFAPEPIKDSHVTHPSVWDTYILPHRSLFLASGHTAAFLGLGKSQYNRLLGLQGAGKHGQRDDLIAAHGYDCYLDSETEFLTDHGWKRFDDVLDSDKLATFDFIKGQTSGVRFDAVRFDTPLRRIDKYHSGFMYVVEPQLTRCVVTPNHNMVASPASRNPKLGFSTKYYPGKADWRLVQLSDLMGGVKARVVRSMYHTPRSASPRIYQYDVMDEYLSLAGLYLSEGSISFREGRVKSVRVVQTPEGKEEYYQYADRLRTIFHGHRYDYPREHVEYETVWTFPRKLAYKLYEDFGHHKAKHLPDWCFQLGYEQAWILWNSLCLGDGYRTKKERKDGQGTLLYTSVKKLADDVQAMMVSSGHICVVNGPYEYDRDETKLGNIPMYQVYRPADQSQFRCVNFKSGILRAGEEPKQKYGYPIKEIKVENHRVVCFEMPLGTLVTRSQGRPAFQGNCKAAMHMVRSMDECLELLQTGTMTFPRPNVSTLLEIRNGGWNIERVTSEYNRLREAVVEAEKVSPLPPLCDRGAINKIVVEAMLYHWKKEGHL